MRNGTSGSTLSPSIFDSLLVPVPSGSRTGIPLPDGPRGTRAPSNDWTPRDSCCYTRLRRLLQSASPTRDYRPSRSLSMAGSGRNYHRLFSSRTKAKPGPKGPPDDLVRVIVEMKRRNTRFGCPRIAQQINKAFGLNIDKDVVRRVLAKHYRPEHYDGGRSWLTFFRQIAESLWSITLFQSRSIFPIFLSYLIEIGQCTRWIIGYGITGSHFDQMVLFSLFAAGIPMVEESKSLSHANVQPLSHHRRRRKRLGTGRTQTLSIFPRAPPFTELWIGTRRRYYRDYRSSCGALFWGQNTTH